MRLGAGMAILLAAIALGYGAGHFALALSAPAAAVAPGETLARAEDSAAAAGDAAGTVRWPAIFGLPVPEPEAGPVAAPANDYRLMGLVLGDARRWAIVSHAGGEILVREGALLPGGERVRAIEAAGLVIERGQATERIAFESMLEPGAGNGLAALAAPLRPRRTEIPFADLAGRDLRRVFGRAGSVRMVPSAGRQGAPAAEILWVRPGEILERIGLREGDRVLRVNGLAAGDLAMLSRAADQLAEVREYEIAVERSGVLQTITVVLTGGG